ncbi:MAG: hypothetical protein ACLTLP_15040 [Faecalibacillus intestinalis]
MEKKNLLEKVQLMSIVEGGIQKMKAIIFDLDGVVQQIIIII